MSSKSDGHFTITIQDQEYYSGAQTSADKERFWQRVLKEAKEKGWVPLCRCYPNVASNELVVRRHSKQREYFVLARYPGQGPNHRPECRFYGARPELSGLQGYVEGVVTETSDGFDIKLSLGNKVKDLATPTGGGDVANNVSPGLPKPRKAAMSLLGLLHLLFVLGRLNIWYSAMKGKRSWSVVARVLVEDAAEKIRCGAVRLNDMLLVGVRVEGRKDEGGNPIKDAGQPARERLKGHNEALVASASQDKRRVVMVGLLAGYAALTKDGAPLPSRLSLRCWDGLPFMNCDAADWTRAERRFEHAWAAWKRGEDVCVIAQLEPVPSGDKVRWKVVDLALQALSNGFLPVESEHEAVIANQLVAADRIFEKPLRYDADKGEVFPDFLLLDTETPQYPMEVFGRTDEAYEARAAEKTTYYKKHFDGHWWCWRAATGEAAPPLPPVRDARL